MPLPAAAGILSRVLPAMAATGRVGWRALQNPWVNAGLSGSILLGYNPSITAMFSDEGSNLETDEALEMQEKNRELAAEAAKRNAIDVAPLQNGLVQIAVPESAADAAELESQLAAFSSAFTIERDGIKRRVYTLSNTDYQRLIGQ